MQLKDQTRIRIPIPFNQERFTVAGLIKRIFSGLIIALTVFTGFAPAQSPAFPDEAVGLPLRDELGFIGTSNGMIEAEFLADGSSFPPATLGCDTPSNVSECDAGCIGTCSCGGSGQRLASHWNPLNGLHRHFDNVDFGRFDIAARFREQCKRDRGIGYERVMYAPNVLDTAIQVPHVGLRYQLDYGLNVPDRAEYFWGAQTGSTETGVNAQDLSVRLAVGNEKLMALTQYTMRSLDPDVNANTTGMADMTVGLQSLLVDGKSVKLATLLRTYIATGPTAKGLGTGHTSLEYGLLGRKCLSPETYLFGEMKYWMPIAGTSDVAGDVLSTGWGVSTIAAESDVFAFLPTFEMRTLSFLFGGETPPGGGSNRRIDGVTAVELYPGARFVFDRQSDLGLVEFGFAAGVTVADDEWFDTRWVFDLRFSR